jgi:glycosyltransferase involved in cell wall biosynthesis
MLMKSPSSLKSTDTPSALARPRAIFLSSYPPRKCGIATFAEDIRGAYDDLVGTASDVIAVNGPDSAYDYPDFVIGQIDRDDAASYHRAARIVNASSADVVNIQHEYGLFGGFRGAMLFEFLQAVDLPVVLTLHTTLPDPDEMTLAITRELCNRSASVVVLTNSCKNTLAARYGIDPAKISIILHGVPDVAPYHGPFHKRSYGLEHATVLSTFGLLSPGKGIETIIEALPEIVAAHPDVQYVLWGQTHPEIRRRDGEAYRDGLINRATELGVFGSVRFVDRYLPDDEVVAALLATDVYLSPSLDPHQAVSGTLSYAVAAGRAVVATPYRYARELLSDGRGVIVPFRDSGALAESVKLILSDDAARGSLETTAYRFGRQMTWPKVALQYRGVFYDSLFAAAPPLEAKKRGA